MNISFHAGNSGYTGINANSAQYKAAKKMVEVGEALDGGLEMAISGVGLKFYQNNVATTKGTKSVNSAEKFTLEKTRGTQEVLNEKVAKMEQERSRLSQSWNSVRQMAKASNAYDANIMMETVVGVDTLETKDGYGNVSDEKETGNKTDIIVKPDGSRVLVVTMSVGGMETTMSIEISKPTNMQNDNLKHDNDNGGTPLSESEAISNDISDTVSEA